jgi:hypothetical protein
VKPSGSESDHEGKARGFPQDSRWKSHPICNPACRNVGSLWRNLELSKAEMKKKSESRDQNGHLIPLMGE